MTPEQFRQIEALFHRGKDLSPEEQRAFLDSKCDDDPEVRAEVEKLLAQAAPDETLAPLRGEVGEVLRPGADDPPAATGGPDIEGYDIIREIHRGGQGVVYQAVQKSTKRKVAIKVLLEGPYASKSARRRFEREIELVAQLKHPNIIGIFHSGQNSGGRQYCVMDYVRGVPLDQYVRHEKLTLEDALKLFAKVCEAVNYAHQKGVIHRDLKPSNILVDSGGEPKVLDFGLAKQLVSPEASLVSLTGQVVGTLPYMSPEQAEGNPDKIDIRTDVYALGVILYQMLTGHYPYPVAGQMAEVLKHIAETPPTPPTRSWKSGSGVTQRAHKRLRPGQCPIDDEVQTIVLRTLAKERERRYQSAGELAKDVAHYLANEPIDAKRDSLPYIFWKKSQRWTVRHRFGASILTLLIAYAVGLPTAETERPVYPDRVIQQSAHRAVPQTWSDELMVISISDETYAAIPKLSGDLGLAHVSQKSVKSWRSLHGALMRKLAGARPSVVAWDYNFRTPESLHDAGFLDGVDALQAVGARVLITVRDRNNTGELVICPAIAAGVDGWGWSTLYMDKAGAIRGALLAEVFRGNTLVPSLSLAAFAAHRRDDFTPVFLWDGKERVTVRYSRPDRGNPRMIEWSPEEYRLRVTGVAANWVWGLPSGTAPPRRYALYTHALAPSREVVAEHTMAYEAVFEMDDGELRDRLEGKTIVIGDTRVDTTRRPDRGPTATREGKRLEFHCYMHVAAINDLLKQTRVIGPTTWQRRGILGAACIIGALIGCLSNLLHRRWFFCLTTCAVVSILSLVGVYGVAVVYYLMIRPTGPIMAIWIAAAGSTLVCCIAGKHQALQFQRPAHPVR